MLLKTDTLLSEKFFFTLDSSPELHKAFQDEKNVLTARIKTELYPNVERVVYYLGKHLDRKALDSFVFVNPEANRPVNSEEYKLLQNQFNIIIKKLQQWGEIHDLGGGNSLDDFLIKLQNPTEKMTLLYADGKRSLEIMTVLLINDQIPLELRKIAYIQLLADNELSKCIDGCYTRIVSSMRQLELYRQSPNQINRWVRAYATQVANEIAAQRPFAMPESYQVLVCRTLDISVTANELHASNYLLIKAKENKFPVDGINDIGALEIKHKMQALNQDKLTEFYLDDLAEAITAKGLVHYIARRLHDDFSQITADPIREYSEKITAMDARLQLLGSDPDFLHGEILEDEPFGLKSIEQLMITTERRLSQQGWLKVIEPEEIKISNKIYTYYSFPGNMELNWFSRAGDTTRYRYSDLIENSDNGLGLDSKFQILAGSFRRPSYFSDAKDLIDLLAKGPLIFPLTQIIPTQHIVTLLKKKVNSISFAKFLNSITIELGSGIIKQLGNEYISDTITEGYLISKVKHRFYWLKNSYFLQYYNQIAVSQGLQVTQQLLQQIIERGYRNFNGFIFHRLNYLDYLNGINFSGCSMEKALFLQPVISCTFDQANLKGVHFDHRVAYTSFREVDLRETTFFQPINDQNLGLALKSAILSTNTFMGLVNSGIFDFSEADLTHVHFHTALPKKNLYLDFSGANLKNAFLSGIDFKHINLQGSNLENTNLIDSFFNKATLDNKISIQGATLNTLTAHTFFLAGVRQFDHCKIIEFQITSLAENFGFTGVSFRGTYFLGYIYDIEFNDCDLKGAYFTVTKEFPIQEESAFVFNVKFKNSKLEGVTFQNIKLLEPVKLDDSPLRNVVLDNIEMPASALFKFYASGQRDFNGVKALKEKIPDKLPPFPLLGASLSKDVFVQLYKQGLRDFRSSNLFGFYLAKVLEEEAISEIELKLEGAHYLQSPLKCGPGSPRSQSPHNLVKRDTSNCKVYFLIQKSQTKRTISWRDLEELQVVSPDNSKLLKEVVLGSRPLYVLDNLTDLHFYWGYKPDSESLVLVSDFLQKSTPDIQRSFLRVNFYFDHIKASDLELLNQNVQNLGFNSGKFTYLDEKNRQMIWNLKEKSPTEIAKINTLSGLDDKIKLPVKPTLPNKNWRTQLKTSITNLRMHAKDQGTQYDAFLVLLEVISTWINQDTVETKKITLENELDLQDFASEFVDQEALNHNANDHQHSLTFKLAVQCIKRGECHNRELVKKNILNTLGTLQPDQVIGFQELGKQIKKGFEDLGGSITKRLDEFAFRTSILIYLYETSKKAKIQKRKIVNWYDQPQFVYFIKMIESAFDELGFDLNLDPDYSESLLAGYLYDLGQALKKQGVSNQTPLNTTLDLLENPQFIQSTLDGSYLNQDKIYLLKQSNTTLVTSSPIQLITTPPKTNRAVNDTKLDRHENSLSERQERYRQIADDYMIHYDWKPKGLKGSRGIGGSRRSKRSNEIKEPSTSFALTKFQREKASKTYNDKSGQKVEKKILHKPDNLMARNSGKQPNKSVILSGFTQPALTKPRNHQRGFIRDHHTTSKISSSKYSLPNPFFVKKRIVEKESLPPPLKIHSHLLPSHANTEKRPISQVTASPNTLAMLGLLNLAVKTNQKNKPIASFQKKARYQKANDSIAREENPFNYYLSFR